VKKNKNKKYEINYTLKKKKKEKINCISNLIVYTVNEGRTKDVTLSPKKSIDDYNI